MFRKLLWALLISFAASSLAQAEGVWRQDRGRGWHYAHHGQNYYWLSPTLFSPAEYYWFDPVTQAWIAVERKAFYEIPYATTYGYYSVYPGWFYDRGTWRRDDKRGTHDWSRGDREGRKHTSPPADLPKKAQITVPKPKEAPSKPKS